MSLLKNRKLCMSYKSTVAIVSGVVLASGFTGCSRKADVTKDLEKAAREMERAESAAAPSAVAQPTQPSQSSQAIPTPATANTPPPAAQQMNRALAAYKSGDYEDAVIRLQRLRATRAMSSQERMALQDAMASVMADIYARAARGDPRAQQAVKEYERMQTTSEIK